MLVETAACRMGDIKRKMFRLIVLHLNSRDTEESY